MTTTITPSPPNVTGNISKTPFHTNLTGVFLPDSHNGPGLTRMDAWQSPAITEQAPAHGSSGGGDMWHANTLS